MKFETNMVNAVVVLCGRRVSSRERYQSKKIFPNVTLSCGNVMGCCVNGKRRKAEEFDAL